MKAAPMKTRPAFPLMKQTDIQNAFHLQMPRWLFTDPNYITLALEAKVVYTFLLNRFQLSKLNGWVNDAGEVFIIYTRASLAEESQISYRKVIESMKALSAANLIWEKRCGWGDANQIYLARVEHRETRGGSAPFVDKASEAAGGEPEAPRSAETALQEDTEAAWEPEGTPAPEAVSQSGQEGSGETMPFTEVPDQQVMKCQTGTSRSAESAGQDLPFSHPSNTDKSHTELSSPEVSPSVPPARARDRPTNQDVELLNGILERCELDSFEPELAKVFETAIERLFFTEVYRIGGAALPRAKVRSHLYELDVMILRTAEAKLHQNTREIKNSTAYTMAVVFNAITESESDLQVDPYLNQLRQLPEGGR